MGKATSICVEYKFTDGWHVFQSDDIQGLYVANKNAEISYNDVKTAIEKLIFLNEGINCTVWPELDFEEFISAVRENTAMEGKGHVPVLNNRRYLISAAA